MGNIVGLLWVKHFERQNPNYLAVAGWKNFISCRCRLAVKSPHDSPNTGMCSVAEFIVPDWGNKVNSGIIGLSYRTAMLHRLAGRY